MPCLPTLSKVVPTSADWIHEHKWDGYRIVARRHGDLVRLWSRNGRNWADAFPAIVDAIRALPTDNVVIDGEAVCLREDGHPDFHALLNHARSASFTCHETRWCDHAVRDTYVTILNEVEAVLFKLRWC